VRGVFGKLIGWLADVVREINHANEVMRVPEERVRYSSSARRVGGPAAAGGSERRCVRDERLRPSG
jgi:hypothetical protein